MYQQEPFYPEEWEDPADEYWEDPYAGGYDPEEEYEYLLAYPVAPAYPTPDLGILIVLALLVLFGFAVIKNGIRLPATEAAAAALLAAPPTPTPTPDPLAFAAPYEHYRLTQGPHGQSYGHLAIDLAAGRGTPVLSPINGVVTDNYVDQWGNTTLVIENEVYRVLLLHGDYTAEVGEVVRVGDPVGTESNHGYTTDMVGNLCYGRVNCGNHTHLNVYDKRLRANVNPLRLIQK